LILTKPFPIKKSLEGIKLNTLTIRVMHIVETSHVNGERWCRRKNLYADQIIQTLQQAFDDFGGNKLGTLPGKKFVWLKAEGVDDLDTETLRISPKYAKLLELSRDSKAEATYKNFTLVARVELSESIRAGKMQINKKHLAGISEGTPFLLMKYEKKEK